MRSSNVMIPLARFFGSGAAARGLSRKVTEYFYRLAYPFRLWFHNLLHIHWQFWWKGGEAHEGTIVTCSNGTL